MDRSIIEQRISAVENNTGSVVGTATWCALHADQAQEIVTCVGERMCGASCSSDSRCALLFVLHELVLSAMSNGTTERAKRTVLSSIFRTLPNVLKRARGLPDPSSTFAASLNRVLSWWSLVKAFPEVWIDELRAPILCGATAESGVAEELRTVNRLLLSFNAARDSFNQLAATEGADPTAVDAAKEDAVHRLVHVQKAIDGRGGASTSLASHLQAELVKLCGSADLTTTGTELSEANQRTLKIEDDGDVLGSFF
jgi:hypothetical protein